MKRFWIVLVFNIAFVVALIHAPESRLHYNTNQPREHIMTDTESYLNPPAKDIKRTVGYPALLSLVTKCNNWYFVMVLINCFLGAWLFYVTYQMIGPWAWLLFFLGAYTVYVPLILTDLLFATLFVTCIYRLKQRDLWGHFILLGMASLIRPSLAWFFVVEPFVLWFYGYRGKTVYYSAAIAFIVTAFSPVRNLINHGIWTHSNILQHNITLETYFAGRESIPQYFVKAFRANFLSDHYKYIGFVFDVPRTGMRITQIATLKGAVYFGTIFINIGVWLMFGVRFLRQRINPGDALILAYFVVPTLFGAAGARIRLPIEWILFL